METRKIKVKVDNDTLEEVELSPSEVNFYKKETRRIRVTDRGLSKFFSNLIKKFISK